MTIKQARKILGKQSRGVSDKELQRDIEVAELLKSLFFNMTTNSLKEPQQRRLIPHNVP